MFHRLLLSDVQTRVKSTSDSAGSGSEEQRFQDTKSLLAAIQNDVRNLHFKVWTRKIFVTQLDH